MWLALFLLSGCVDLVADVCKPFKKPISNLCDINRNEAVMYKELICALNKKCCL